eukprot:CAMPEP_0197572668 /NCGR_PEP_ID=MMETSP1320-20131121/42577_1 /TAXON_ID=91990 /ORGANISM="Bolidomonas sp., Strain RCC2347" /LENGTH=470 /DNA_ID=CAMNT_0043135175 /DNA_START=48 /DNA_END=1457 /DNA_ORIENTATION=+
MMSQHVAAFKRMRIEEETADEKFNRELRRMANENDFSDEDDSDSSDGSGLGVGGTLKVVEENEDDEDDNDGNSGDEKDQNSEAGGGSSVVKVGDEEDTVDDTLETAQAIRTAETVISRDMGGTTPTTVDHFGSPVSNLSSDAGSLETIMSNRLNKVELLLEKLLESQQENRARLQKLDEVTEKVEQEGEQEPTDRGRAGSPVESDISMLSGGGPQGGVSVSTPGGNIVGRDLILAEQTHQDQTSADIAVLVRQVQNLTELQREQHTLRSTGHDSMHRSPEPQVVERVIERHHVVVEGEERARARKKKGFWKRLLCCLGDDASSNAVVLHVEEGGSSRGEVSEVERYTLGATNPGSNFLGEDEAEQGRGIELLQREVEGSHDTNDRTEGGEDEEEKEREKEHDEEEEERQGDGGDEGFDKDGEERDEENPSDLGGTLEENSTVSNFGRDSNDDSASQLTMSTDEGHNDNGL